MNLTANQAVEDILGTEFMVRCPMPMSAAEVSRKVDECEMQLMSFAVAVREATEFVKTHRALGLEMDPIVMATWRKTVRLNGMLADECLDWLKTNVAGWDEDDR